MNRRLTGALAAVLASAASAHVSIASGNATANASQEVVFSVGHGCNDGTRMVDTYRLKVDIPMGFTAVRPMASGFGPFTIEKDQSGAVTSVTWTKPLTDVRADDDAFYRLTLRMKVPDKPFSTVYFPVHQTCRDASGAETVVDWVGTPSVPADEPAATLIIVGAHQPGWNKYTAPVAIPDLSVYFKDAVIVWKGSAAYSFNGQTTAQIAATRGTGALATIEAGDELWVKY
ncbi:MAG TPA: DUF1775 domain-containing protein [Myxococcaceae bacterium]|jgi:uncharacterized protein YcnI